MQPSPTAWLPPLLRLERPAGRLPACWKVHRGGAAGPARLVAGERLHVAPADAGGRLCLLVPRTAGRPRLGRRLGGRWVTEPGAVPCGGSRWRVAGAVVGRWRPLGAPAPESAGASGWLAVRGGGPSWDGRLWGPLDVSGLSAILRQLPPGAAACWSVDPSCAESALPAARAGGLLVVTPGLEDPWRVGGGQLPLPLPPSRRAA